jgi:AcrR family transcriptional regulator
VAGTNHDPEGEVNACDHGRGTGEAVVSAGAEPAPAGPSRPPRGSLTPERIVDESMALLDRDGVAGFSLPKLGRALRVDPTAVYRHFVSKDDLVLAIADRLIGEAMEGLEPSDCWVDTLVDVATRLRRTYLTHPAAASLSMFRTTRRPAEMHAVDVIVGALLEAGFRGAEAAVVYRAWADFSLSFSGGEASFQAMDPQVQAQDRQAWAGAYLTAERATHPNLWRIRTALPKVADDQIFTTVLGLVMDGLVLRAPTPCSCGRHAPRRG